MPLAPPPPSPPKSCDRCLSEHGDGRTRVGDGMCPSAAMRKATRLNGDKEHLNKTCVFLVCIVLLLFCCLGLLFDDWKEGMKRRRKTVDEMTFLVYSLDVA